MSGIQNVACKYTMYFFRACRQNPAWLTLPVSILTTTRQSGFENWPPSPKWNPYLKLAQLFSPFDIWQRFFGSPFFLESCLLIGLKAYLHSFFVFSLLHSLKARSCVEKGPFQWVRACLHRKGETGNIAAEWLTSGWEEPLWLTWQKMMGERRKKWSDREFFFSYPGTALSLWQWFCVDTESRWRCDQSDSQIEAIGCCLPEFEIGKLECRVATKFRGFHLGSHSTWPLHLHLGPMLQSRDLKIFQQWLDWST